MNTLLKNKQALVVVLILVVLGVGGYMLTRGNSDTDDAMRKDSTLPGVEVVPTVDASVKVDLTTDKLKQNATLTVDNYPTGTKSIEYELSYDALVEGEYVPKGVIGDADVTKGTMIEKKITLGTCSSGTCKYDQGVKSIHALVRFTGSYGAQLFEGDFDL